MHSTGLLIKKKVRDTQEKDKTRLRGFYQSVTRGFREDQAVGIFPAEEMNDKQPDRDLLTGQTWGTAEKPQLQDINTESNREVMELGST